MKLSSPCLPEYISNECSKSSRTVDIRVTQVLSIKIWGCFLKQQAAADNLKEMHEKYLPETLSKVLDNLISFHTASLLGNSLPFIQSNKAYKKKVTGHLFCKVSFFCHRKQFFQILAKKPPNKQNSYWCYKYARQRINFILLLATKITSQLFSEDWLTVDQNI